MVQFDAYFSDGLKPQTSSCLMIKKTQVPWIFSNLGFSAESQETNGDLNMSFNSVRQVHLEQSELLKFGDQVDIGQRFCGCLFVFARSQLCL